MSDEIVAIFGKVSQVRDYASLGLTRIIIDIPVEFHVNATAMLYGQDVLVTMAPKTMAGSPYGPRRSSGTEDPEPPIGSPERQPWQDRKNAAANAALDATATAKDGPMAKGGPLSELAGQWCRLPAFQKWAKVTFPDVAKALPLATRPEQVAREIILQACGVLSRKELDHQDTAAMRFQELIRLPYMAHGAKEQASG